MTRIAGKLSRFTQKEIDALFAHSRCTLKHRGLTFLIAPQQGTTFGRLLVVTSRKVGTAPVRNKIRRQLKALFYQDQLYTKGHDCIVIVKKESVTIPFAKLRELLVRAIPTATTDSAKIL